MIILLILFTSIILSDEIVISSILKNFDNDPIYNANIECTNTGTSSDEDGLFSIKCKEFDTIKISHILYETKILNSNNFPSQVILDSKIITTNIINVYGQLDPTNRKVPSTQIINKLSEIAKTSNHFEDISYKISNLNYAAGTSRPRYFQIRGLGELSQFSGEGAPHYYVGYIIDNIDFSGIGMIGSLFDIQQIEVFKGSHSTIFGQNALGGQININTLDPQSKKVLQGNFSLQNYNTTNFNLFYSNKLSEKLSYSSTISKYYTDGYITNKQLIDGNDTYLNNTNSKDEQLVRTKLLYQNQNIYAKITLLYSSLDNKYDAWAPDNNGFITYTDFRGYDTQQTNALSIYLKKSYDNYKLISISTYSDNNMLYSYDGDWGNDEFWSNDPYNIDNNNYFDSTERTRINKSQEFRLIENVSDKSKIILGVIRSNTIEKDNRDGWIFGGEASNIYSDFDITITALYSQFIVNLNNKSTINLSLRNDYNSTSNTIICDECTYDSNEIGNIHYNQRDNLIGGNIKYEYKLSNYTTLSTFFSSGYKSAGINQSPNVLSQYRNYHTEYAYNSEIGLESNYDNYKYNFSLFYTHRIQPQVRFFHQYDNVISFDYLTLNTDLGYNYGMEFEIEYIVFEQLILHGSFGYLSTYISSFSYDDIEYGDREQAHSPNYTYNVDLKYNIGKFISLNIIAHGMDEFYFDDQYQFTSKPRDLLDLSIGYNDNNFGITIWAKNILDKKYDIRGYTFGLEPPNYDIKNYQSFGSPKVFGITFFYSL